MPLDESMNSHKTGYDIIESQVIQLDAFRCISRINSPE